MYDLITSRRSIRKYKSRSIEKEAIDRILQAALTSPSGKSNRPWELIIIDDKEQLNKLGDSRGSHSRPLSNAPLGVIVIADPEKTDTYVEDSSIIAIIIQLLAESEGLGSCWVQVRNRVTPWDESVEDYVKGILQIPSDYVVECMVAIGYPDEEKKPHDKDDLPYDKIHYGRYKR